MNRREIEAELQKHDNTVLSFPNRGPWGSSAYRGNCSGWIPAFFIWKYGVTKLAEIFAGSGTTYDVCKDMNVQYTGIDLNPNPMRDGIVSMDILDDSIELPDGFYDADMLFLHPPYPSIHDVHYSNDMWEDTAGVASRDIQEMSWKMGMNAVNHAILRGYSAMQPGAYEVILVGEIRSKGQYHSMYQQLAIPGILHQTFVKLQHNTVSGRRQYSKKSDFSLTGHEMIAVIKKPSGFELAYIMPRECRMDIRDCKMATWKDLVMSVVRDVSGNFSCQMVCDMLRSHKKAQNTNNLDAKIRQTLQILADAGFVKHVNRGVWCKAA